MIDDKWLEWLDHYVKVEYINPGRGYTGTLYGKLTQIHTHLGYIEIEISGKLIPEGAFYTNIELVR